MRNVTAHLQVLAVNVGPVQSLFATADLTVGDWILCVAIASSVVAAEELRKLISRHRANAPLAALGVVLHLLDSELASAKPSPRRSPVRRSARRST